MAFDWSGAGAAGVSGVLGMLGGVGQGNRGYHRNKKLMRFSIDKILRPPSRPPLDACCSSSI